jgi:hypothetical protein
VDAWVALEERGHPVVSKWFVIAVHVEDSDRHFSYTGVRWRLSAKILIEDPLNKKLLLPWS